MALVVFLRGVNVGGHRTFRPAELAKQLGHLGAVNIGAAGTFVIRQPVSRGGLRSELKRRLPFEVDIAVCQGGDLVRLASGDFFAGQADRPEITRFVSVLCRAPRSTPALPTEFGAGGKWLLKVLAREGPFIVGLYRREMKAIGYLGKLDRLFGAPLTTRNWNTIGAIRKVLERREG